MSQEVFEPALPAFFRPLARHKKRRRPIEDCDAAQAPPYSWPARSGSGSRRV